MVRLWNLKWKIVIIQTFECTCWQRIRQQKNQQRNFIFPNIIPHTEKKCCELQFWRIWQGYTHRTPTVSIAYILVLCIPKVLVGQGAFQNKKMNRYTWLKRLFLVTFVTYCAQAVHAINSQHFYRPFWSGTLSTYTSKTYQIAIYFDLENFIVFSF